MNPDCTYNLTGIRDGKATADKLGRSWLVLLFVKERTFGERGEGERQRQIGGGGGGEEIRQSDVECIV